MTFQTDRHVPILIVGGGAIGTSLAYHLARDGAKDVLLVEKAQLTHGCTWHAAGLVGQLRSKRNLTRLMQNSVAILDRLEEESGLAIDWRKVGSLRLASSDARWSEIRRSMTLARSFDFECHPLSAKEARDLRDELRRTAPDDLAAGFVLAAAVVRHLAADPLLPPSLLPARWPGDDLRATYDTWVADYQRVLADWHRSR